MAGEPLDLLYLVRCGEDNEELRHSLRSVQANLPHGRVWIAGYRPTWVNPAATVHVPVPADRDKHRATTANLRAALAHSGIPAHVVLFNDDFFVLRPLAGVPMLHRGPVADLIATSGGGAGGYFAGARETAQLLRRLGHLHPVSYELHVPMVVDTAVMRRLLETYDGLIRCLHKRTLYGNLAHCGGRQIPDVKVAKDGQRWDRDAMFVSTNDGPFKRGEVGRWLRSLFPDPCRYERPPRDEENLAMAKGPATYRNTVTGRVVDLDAPDIRMDRSRRWERLDPTDAGAAAAGAGTEVERPSGNASADQWRAYAIAQGMDPDEAAESSRNDLRDRYPDQD